jgi:hypothetical protein
MYTVFTKLLYTEHKAGQQKCLQNRQFPSHLGGEGFVNGALALKIAACHTLASAQREQIPAQDPRPCWQTRAWVVAGIGLRFGRGLQNDPSNQLLEQNRRPSLRPGSTLGNLIGRGDCVTTSPTAVAHPLRWATEQPSTTTTLRMNH